MFVVQRFCATHDPSGNPRRVFVFKEVKAFEAEAETEAAGYDLGGYAHIVFTFDEGYSSLRNAMEAFRTGGHSGPVIDLGDVDTSVTQYRRFVRWDHFGGLTPPASS